MNKPAKNERDIFLIMKFGTALGFGCAAASLQALRASPTGFSFHVSSLALLAFMVGAAAVFACWKIILNRSANHRQKTLRFGVGLGLLLLGVGAFLYPLRFVPRDKFPDLFIGLVTAVCALSIGAGILLLISRFFESDERENKSATIKPVKQ